MNFLNFNAVMDNIFVLILVVFSAYVAERVIVNLLRELIVL